MMKHKACTFQPRKLFLFIDYLSNLMLFATVYLIQKNKHESSRFPSAYFKVRQSWILIFLQ